jgi:Ca-activated chloride channel homolog
LNGFGVKGDLHRLRLFMKRTNSLALIAILNILFCLPPSLAQDIRVQAGEQSASSKTAAGADTAPAIIPAGHKFIMQLETDLHTQTTRKGDHATFKTAGEIVADNQPVIASGAIIRGTVTKCKRAGLLFGNAEINLKLEELLLPDGTAMPLHATIIRIGFDPADPNKKGETEVQGESGAGADAGTIIRAGAQGAIIGGLYGGGKGAAIGSAAGAAITAAGMILRRGPDIDLPRNTMLEARFDNPLEIPYPHLPKAPQSAAASTPVEEASLTEPDSQDVPLAETKRPVLKRRPKIKKEETSVSTASEPDLTGSAPEPSEASVPSVSEPAVSGSASEPKEPELVGARFSVKVQMVLVDAVVKDKAEHIIDNLTQNDFRVYEDGVLQEVKDFSFDEAPLAIAVLVDRSDSIAPYISELRRIATRTLQQLKPSDQVALFSFAGTVDRIENLTTDRGQIADSITRIQAGGGTNINDALYEAANYLGRAAPSRRHAIIMVSDNQATVNSLASEEEVISEALETDTVVYSIKTQKKTDLVTFDVASVILGTQGVDRIAHKTGGEVLKASSVSKLDEVLGSIISRLRKRYLLGYYPSNASPGGAYHTIEVRLDERHGQPGKDYFMHARQGYYSTSSRAKIER